MEASQTAAGQVTSRWWIDRQALAAVVRAAGRYLPATNAPHSTPQQMLALYRDEDVAEKRFRVFEQDRRVRPAFVHSDERLRAMLLIDSIALLAYSLLERQAHQHGLCFTAHRLLEQLASLHVVEIEAGDGSRTQRLGDLTPDQQRLILHLAQASEPPTSVSAALPTALPRWSSLSPGLPPPPEPSAPGAERG